MVAVPCDQTEVTVAIRITCRLFFIRSFILLTRVESTRAAVTCSCVGVSVSVGMYVYVCVCVCVYVLGQHCVAGVVYGLLTHERDS